MPSYVTITVAQPTNPHALRDEELIMDRKLDEMIALHEHQLTMTHRNHRWELAGVILYHQYKYRLIFKGTLLPPR